MRRILPIAIVLLAGFAGNASAGHHHRLTLAQLQHEPAELEATHKVGSGRCGVERWAVKTVQDFATIRLTPVRSSIAKLGAIPVPAGLGQNARRLPGESQVYQLTGTLLFAIKQEADSDYHLALQGPTGATMIAEIPAPVCAASSSVLAQITTARAYVDQTFGPATDQWRTINRHVILTGVFFYDLKHGQSGVAPNGSELHPVLSIRTQR